MSKFENIGIEQRSLDWYRSRLGCFTGSEVWKLMGKGRSKSDIFSQTAKTYIWQVMGERMMVPDFINDDDVFGDYVEQTSHTTKAMQWGIEQEASAKRVYMDRFWKGHDLIEVGSCPHDTIPHFAASPDGFVRSAGAGGGMWVIEVKCPTVGVFAQYASEIHDGGSLKAVKPEYYWQMMAEMDCSGCDGGDFVVYCPWLTRQLHVAHVERNEWDISAMEDRVRLANRMIDNVMEEMKDQ